MNTNLTNSPSLKSSTRPTTYVNGIGMYHSWKRNFKSPFYAMLDIIDNAIDAGFHFHGNYTNNNRYNNDLRADDVQSSLISASYNSSSSSKGKIEVYENSTKILSNTRHEVIIVNNSFHEIMPLDKILEVYKSDKGNGPRAYGSNYGKNNDLSDHIGQNGVGLKQGCAALSDLSFVLVRNSKAISFGIIAKSLQHEEGCYLPSFQLDSSSNMASSLKNALKYRELANVKECITQYGFGSFDEGIKMLANHITQMKDPANWGCHKHVFKLIITDVKDDNKDRHDNVDQTEISYDDENALEQVMSASSLVIRRNNSSPTKKKNSKHGPFESLMLELITELPRYYIHIPKEFHVTINEVPIYFNFWQTRMVNMVRFDQAIGLDESYRELENIRLPSTQSSHKYITMRFFCGFDPIRVTSDTEQRSASLYIYSRKSGRLIKHEPDARNMLKLNASGTEFCQGLTCLVDDVDGIIPLNPTKQDVAFSEIQHGDILKENLYAWTSALVTAFYRYNLNRKFGGANGAGKGDLSAELKEIKKQVIKTFGNIRSPIKRQDISSSLTPLADADFLTLDGISYTKKKEADKIIVFVSNKSKEIGRGCDTLFRLRGTEKGKTKSPSTKKAATNVTKKRTTTKRKTAAKIGSPILKRQRGQEQPNYHEYDSDDATKSIDANSMDNPINDSVIDFDMDGNQLSFVENSRVEVVSKSNSISSETEKELEELKKMLEHKENLIAKKNNDYDRLLSVKEMLQSENQRIFDENEALQTEVESLKKLQLESQSQHDNSTYDMLVEVKNNLHDENDRLIEEVKAYEDKCAKLQYDVDYLTKKSHTMECRLEAERALRVAAEEKLEAKVEARTNA